MARTLNRLSDRRVRTAKSGMHCDGGGLYLQVTAGPDGVLRRSWLFRYKSPSSGRERQMGLGPLSLVGLAEARERACQGRRSLFEGIDPIGARDARKASVAVTSATTLTFDQCAKAYVESHSPGWSDRHTDIWQASVKTYVSPVFGDLPVAAIDVGLAMRALEPIWATIPETASRVRGRIESVLDWARARGHREGENPARWRGHLDHLLPKRGDVQAVKNFAAMPYGELLAFMKELGGETTTAARALEFLILTASRSETVLGATWSELDLSQRLWTIPASRMKGGREHRVPLSDAAVDVLERMAAHHENEFVFPGTQTAKMSRAAMLALLRRMGHGTVVVHGFRSAFRDWVSETTNFPSEVAELALAHAVGDKVEQAYRRGDQLAKRRRLMEAWSEFCTVGAATGSVVPLRAG